VPLRVCRRRARGLIVTRVAVAATTSSSAMGEATAAAVCVYSAPRRDGSRAGRSKKNLFFFGGILCVCVCVCTV